VEAVGEQGADLIVVGNHDRGGLISWMLGSTSRSVVESCNVPVLVVKDQEYCEAK
jgi:nucleotide-binding universal stress UspA family protein